MLSPKIKRDNFYFRRNIFLFFIIVIQYQFKV